MDAERRVVTLAESQHGVFTRAQAKSFGMTRKMIRVRVAKGLWVPVHDGVFRLRGVKRSWLQSIRAACLHDVSLIVASHRAAARLHRLAGIETGMLEVVVSKSCTVKRDGVLVHQSRRFDPSDFTIINSVPVTKVARTLVDLAGVVPARIMEGALDDALRRGKASLPKLLEAQVSGVRGTGKLRHALELRAGMIGVPKSVLETKLLGQLSAAKLTPPNSQFRITVGPGDVKSVDFAYPDWRLVVEVQSLEHHLNRKKWEADLARHNLISAVGWQVLYATWSDIASGSKALIAQIRAIQGSRASGSISISNSGRSRPPQTNPVEAG